MLQDKKERNYSLSLGTGLLLNGIIWLCFVRIYSENVSLPFVWSAFPGLVLLLAGFFSCSLSCGARKAAHSSSLFVVRYGRAWLKREGGVFLAMLLVCELLTMVGIIVGKNDLWIVMEVGTILALVVLCLEVAEYENFRIYVYENGKIILYTRMGRRKKIHSDQIRLGENLDALLDRKGKKVVKVSWEMEGIYELRDYLREKEGQRSYTDAQVMEEEKKKEKKEADVHVQRRIEGIHKKFVFLLAFLTVISAIGRFIIPWKIDLKWILFLFGLLSLPVCGYCFIYLKIWGNIPENMKKKLEEKHERMLLLFMIFEMVNVWFYAGFCEKDAIVVEFWKMVGICAAAAGVLAAVGIFCLPKRIRKWKNVITLYFLISVSGILLGHSMLYFVSGEPESYQAEVIASDYKIVSNRFREGGLKNYILTVELKNGTLCKLHVPKYFYLEFPVGEKIWIEQRNAPFGLHFVSY